MVTASTQQVIVTVEGGGDRDVFALGPEDYLVACGARMAVATETRYRNGTVVLTLKRDEEHHDA